MHISEGILSPSVLLTGGVLAVGGVAVGLKRLDYKEIPSAGVLSAAFFVAALIHLPIGPVSAHLTLNGLVGLILGWKAFPTILVGVTLQALLFQFGGLTTLGVNTLNMALPAIMCHCAFNWGKKISTRRVVLTLTAFVCGCMGVFSSGVLVGISLYLTGEAFLPAAKLVVAIHLPVMVVEGLLTAACVVFLHKVRPELLEGRYGAKSE